MRNMVVDKVANRIRWGYLTAFILLLSSYILTFYTTQQLLQQAQLVNNTNSVITRLQHILGEIKHAEAAVFQFYITRDDKYLDSFQGSQQRSEKTYNDLRMLVSERPDQQAKLDTLKLLIAQRYQVMNIGVNQHRSSPQLSIDSQKQQVARGKEVMDKIILSVEQIERGETERMGSEQDQMQAFSNSIKAINIASLIVAVLLAFYSIMTFNKENNLRKEADANAQAFREQLELRISELDKVNKELVELRSQEKFAVTGRISRTIAHEVRNPLTNINLAAEHLRSEIPPTPDTDILLEMITRNANRINILISDLLNSTKAAHLNFEKASINKLLDEALELAQDRIRLHNIKVVKKYSEGVCDLMVDPEKIKIAFLNIIVNAIEAMDPENGELLLSTEVTDGKCKVIIQDNGTGMDKESVSKLFEPYFTTKENGTGLGLTNTHNIILNHKASIYAESEPGKGTKMTITMNQNAHSA